MAHREVSGEDLRERLFETFRDRGVLESMKSILRKKLITELRASGDINLTLDRNAKSPESSLFVHVANSIIADHLKQFGYEYSRAVFLPESGLSVSKQLTTSEILYLLHVEPTSNLYKSLMSFQPNPGGNGSLWEYIVHLVSMHGGGSQTSYGTQTDEFQYPSGLSSVDQEVQHLQKLFSDDLERHKVAETERAEEQIQLVRRRCERRSMEEMEAEMKSFRKVELERTRLQERQKWMAEIDLIRDQKAELACGISDEKKTWEREISLAQKQINMLREKETEMEQQMKRYQETVQAAKQSKERLLPEGSMEGLMEKDTDANTGELLTNYARKLDAANESLKLKENILAQMEGHYEEMLKTKMERYKQEQEVEFQRKLQDLKFREATFQADKERFDKERAKTETDKVVPLRVEELATNSHSLSYAHVQHMNEVLTRQLDEMKDYKELKASEQAQRSIVESLQQQLSEKVKYSVDQQVEYDKVIKEASENSSRLNSELTELHHRIASVTEQSDSFRNASENLTAQLEQERFANHALRTLYEEQLRQQKDLMKEFEHFQTTTGLTGQGLVAEDEQIRAGSGTRPARVPSQEPTGTPMATEVDDITDEESSSGTFVGTSNDMLERMDKQAEELDEIFTNFLSGMADTNNRGQDSILRRLRNAFRNTPMPASPAPQRERPSSVVEHPSVIIDSMVADRSLGVDSLIESFLPFSSQDGGYVMAAHPVPHESIARSSMSGGDRAAGSMNASFLSDHTLSLQVPHESIKRSSMSGGDRAAADSMNASFLSDHTLSLKQVPRESRSSVSGGDMNAGFLSDHNLSLKQVPHASIARSSRTDGFLSDHTLSLKQVPHESIPRSSMSGGDRSADSMNAGFLSDQPRESILRSSMSGGDRAADSMNAGFLSDQPRESILRSSMSGGDRSADSMNAGFLSDQPRESILRSSMSGGDRAADSMIAGFLSDQPRESIPRSSVSGGDRAADSMNAGFLSDQPRESIPRSSMSGGDRAADSMIAGFVSDHTLSANAVSRESIARSSMTDGLSDQYFIAPESAAKVSTLGVEASYPDYSSRYRLSVVASGTMFQEKHADPTTVYGSQTDGSTVRASPLAYRSVGGLSATTEAREPSSPPGITDTTYRAERSFSRLEYAATDTMSANIAPRETIARGSVLGRDRPLGSTSDIFLSDQYLIANAKPTTKDSVSGVNRPLGSTSDIFVSDQYLIANATPTANGSVSDVVAGYSGYPSRCLLSVMASGSTSRLPDDDSAVGGSETGSTVRDAPLAYGSVGGIAATTEAREPRAERSSSMLEDAARETAGTTGSLVAPINSRSAANELEGLRAQRIAEQFDHKMPEGPRREEREKEREVDQHLLEELESQEEEVRSILDLEDMEEDSWLVEVGHLKSPATAADKHDQSAWSAEQREASGFQDSGQEYDDPYFTGLDRDDIESFYPDHVDASESSW